MSRFAVPIGVLICLAAHIVLGWEYGVVGAIFVGWAAENGGFKLGAMTMGISWSILIGYNFIIAGPESVKMIKVMASIMGDLPGFATIVITLGVSLVLGGIGGLSGAAFKSKGDK